MATSNDTIPELSIVVPIYNVASYLPACLESLSALSDVRAEFILVDDGSTDLSLTIAREMMDKDPRFQLLQADCVGPGEARNLGIGVAQGELLGFLDGDDVMVAIGYLAGLNMLRESESDFVTCAFCRLKGDKIRKSKLSRGHDHDRTGIRIEDQPDLIYASTFWNKIYRKGFFLEVCYPISRGVLQDILPNLRAFSLSERFDVSHALAVQWRIREDGSSITQKKNSSRNITDRINVMNACLDFLDDRPVGHANFFRQKAISHDAGILTKSAGKANSKEVSEAISQVFRRLLSGADAMDLSDAAQANVTAMQAFINKTGRKRWH